MTHDKLRQMLARRHELTEKQSSTLKTHLRSCAECRLLAAEYDLQDTALRPLGPQAAPAGLRSAILTRVAVDTAVSSSRRPAWRPFAQAGLAVAVLAAVVLVAVQGWSLLTSRQRLLSEAAAIRTALRHTVVALDRHLPPTVHVRARLGKYPGVDTAWLVTISGPGVQILPPRVVTAGFPTARGAPLHRETAVVDGRTGAYVETFTSSG